jgi:hypothetical protein
MVKTSLTQDGIGCILPEPFYLPFSRLKKRQVSDGVFTLGDRLAGREGVVSPFCPGPLSSSGNLAQPCGGHVDKRSNVPVAAAGLLAQKSLTRDLTFGAIE